MFGVPCELDELRHFVSFIVVEGREDSKSLDDLVCALVNDCYNVFDVDLAKALVLREILVGINGFCVHNLLAVDSDDFIAENRSDDSSELKKGKHFVEARKCKKNA